MEAAIRRQFFIYHIREKSRYYERAGVSKKSTLGSVLNPSLRNLFQETPACYTLVSTNTSDS